MRILLVDLPRPGPGYEGWKVDLHREMEDSRTAIKSVREKGHWPQSLSHSSTVISQLPLVSILGPIG